MDAERRRRLPVFIGGIVVMVLFLGVGVWQLVSEGAPTTPEASESPSPTETEGPIPTANDPVARSLGLPPANPGGGGDIDANATPGAFGATKSETVARVFAARFSVFAPVKSTAGQDWIDSWAPIAVPSLVNAGDDFVQSYHSDTWRDAFKTMSPNVKSAQKVWAGPIPSGPAELWRVSVIRNKVPLSGPSLRPVLETVNWDIVVHTTGDVQVTQFWRADPKRTAPPRED